jgi:hypothetical protein
MAYDDLEQITKGLNKALRSTLENGINMAFTLAGGMCLFLL